jgi:hypothetical protein
VNDIPSLWPGVVESYDKVRRTCRVSIAGITDGPGTLPEAVFNNPLGDRAADTEIRILPGDAVWLMFEAGDPRYPIIMGYRTPRAGNPVDWRRWHHKNIELIAEDTFLITLGGTSITVTDGLVHIVGADVQIAENLIVGKNVTVAQSIVATQNITAGGNVADAGGSKTMANMRTKFNAHRHPETGTTTATPDQSM